MLEPSREIYFPNLRKGEYRVTSPETNDYNCLAWAVGCDSDWWQPPPGNYWPDGVSVEITLASWRAIFESLGYEVCADAGFEAGFEKVAIFVGGDGLPTHASRQLENGFWTSKLGHWQDIEHQRLDALADSSVTDSLYGTVSLVLRRCRGR